MLSSAPGSGPRAMAKFFAELKRRQMFRVAAAYAVVAWLLLQIVNNVTPGLNLPNWAVTFVIVLLAIGFPVALLFCWIQQLAPGGDASAQVKTNRLDWILAGGLAAVIALLLYQQLAPSPGAGTAQKASVASSTPAPQSAGIAIAVLPLVNLSGDASQEFFSDGMTEEITATLAQVPGLRVLGRTSAFEFKGQNRNLRLIGQALGATHLIEGSVRKAGNRVRVTAQLVRVEDDSHLWVQNYDRDLTDLFAIQDEIAKAIAASLQVPLGLRQGETLVRGRTADETAYEAYLRAKALVRTRGLSQLNEAAGLLDQAVARDPDFAAAWALMALAYTLTPTYHPSWLSGAIEEARTVVDASLPKAEAAAQRALQLDPRNPDGYIAYGLVQAVRGKLLAAEDLYTRAEALDPENTDLLHSHSAMLADLGYLKRALVMRQRLQTLEPFAPIFANLTAPVYALNGQAETAIAIANSATAGAYERNSINLARIYAVLGRYGEAADLLKSPSEGFFLPGTVEAAERLLRAAPTPIASARSLPRLGVLGFAYLSVGAPDRALEVYEDRLKAGYMGVLGSVYLWAPSYAPVRKMERFKDFLRAAGFVDYWKQKGWPDLCRPVGADDFTCD
jgi:TolB-like protein